MNLAPDVEFHEDIRLLIYRPQGLLNEAAINKVLNRLRRPRNEVAGAVQSIHRYTGSR